MKSKGQALVTVLFLIAPAVLYMNCAGFASGIDGSVYGSSFCSAKATVVTPSLFVSTKSLLRKQLSQDQNQGKVTAMSADTEIPAGTSIAVFINRSCLLSHSTESKRLSVRALGERPAPPLEGFYASFDLDEATRISDLESESQADECVLGITYDGKLKIENVQSENDLANDSIETKNVSTNEAKVVSKGSDASANATTFNDPLANQAWQTSSGITPTAYAFFYNANTGIKSTVLTAVVDSGVKLDHPDLVNNIVTLSDGTHGYDFIDSDTDPTDTYGHGTIVSGLLAAQSNNGIGVAGVAGQVARILPVRVLDSSGSGSFSGIANGIRYAADQGAKVINFSIGANGTGSGSETLSLVTDAMAYAVQRGAVFVSAAGNNGSNIDTDGLADTKVGAVRQGHITVGAMYYGTTTSFASFSNYSSTYVEIAAAGAATTFSSTLRNGDYGSAGSGTSFSTPIVSGSAVLVYAILKDHGIAATPAMIEEIIEAGATIDSTLTSKIKNGRVFNLEGIMKVLKTRYPALSTESSASGTGCG